ncbi:MAG: hypothetical protein JOZ11_00075, partial [Alphaproteobacteria bacterium]|nr:hypothetical protein [Alphaproteobacteria bacterium]
MAKVGRTTEDLRKGGAFGCADRQECNISTRADCGSGNRLIIMALCIETFDNTRGGNTLYKALTHPAAARSGRALLDKLARHAPIAIYDAGGALETLSAFYDLDHIDIAGVYVQQVARIGSAVLGRRTRPITELACCRARTVFVAAFDSERIVAQMRPYLPKGAEVFSLDA